MRKKITSKTIKRLYNLAGNQCSAPDCNNSLMARDDKTMISTACHISAASEGGSRYVDEMSDDERREFDNLILLCDECHSIIDDNEEEYPISLLKQWKQDHENKLIRLLAKPKFNPYF